MQDSAVAQRETLGLDGIWILAPLFTSCCDPGQITSVPVYSPEIGDENNGTFLIKVLEAADNLICKA